MPQLTPFYFVNEVIFAFAIILITIYMAFDLLLCLFSSTRNMLYDRITGITHRSDIISRQDNTNLTS